MWRSNYSGILLVSAIWTLGNKIENLLTSTTQMRSRSFHVVYRTRTAAKLLFFTVNYRLFHNQVYSFLFVLLQSFSLKLVTSRKRSVTKYERGPWAEQKKLRWKSVTIWQSYKGSCGEKMLQLHCYGVAFIFPDKMRRIIFFWKYHPFTKEITGNIAEHFPFLLSPTERNNYVDLYNYQSLFPNWPLLCIFLSFNFGCIKTFSKLVWTQQIWDKKIAFSLLENEKKCGLKQDVSACYFFCWNMGPRFSQYVVPVPLSLSFWMLPSVIPQWYLFQNESCHLLSIYK